MIPGTRDARGQALARALRDRLEALTPSELAYKGIVEARERLIAALGALAEGSASR
jgi:hypothetical protein